MWRKWSSKQIIEHHFILGNARIHIPLKTITADKCQLYRLSGLRFLHKTDDFVSQNLLVILIDGKLTFRKLHFAKIDGIVTTLYHHVYLGCPLRRSGITLASPGIQLGSHTRSSRTTTSPGRYDSSPISRKRLQPRHKNGACAATYSNTEDYGMNYRAGNGNRTR